MAILKKVVRCAKNNDQSNYLNNKKLDSRSSFFAWNDKGGSGMTKQMHHFFQGLFPK